MKFQTSFYGREDDLRWLRGHFDEVRAQDAQGRHAGPRLVVVTGPSGYGKSRLLQEFYLQVSRDKQLDPNNYWPDAFIASEGMLDAAACMAEHKPNGLPRFWWFGHRCGSLESAAPTAVARLSAQVSIHKRIIERWRRPTDDLEINWFDELIQWLFDQIPFGIGSYLLRFLRFARRFVLRKREDKSFNQVGQEKATIDREGLVKSMGKLQRSTPVAPMLLWLDDAHQIQSDDLHLLDDLVKRAEVERWPLLVVATLWDNKWKEATEAGHGRADTLGFWSQSKIFRGERSLEQASGLALRSVLMERLPGLNKVQADRVLEKSSGNFLSLQINVDELCAELGNFVKRDRSKELSRAGEQTVVGWSLDRKERAKQRFTELEDPRKMLLGLGSQFEERFLLDIVVASCGATSGVQGDPAQLLARCVTPSCLLIRHPRQTFEFRDPPYLERAREYFDTYMCGEDPDFAVRFQRLVRDHLAKLVADIYARRQSGDDFDASTAAERSFTHDEEWMLLELASQDRWRWNELEDGPTTRVRAIYLALRQAVQENRISQVRQLTSKLGGASDAPLATLVSALPVDERHLLALDLVRVPLDNEYVLRLGEQLLAAELGGDDREVDELLREQASDQLLESVLARAEVRLRLLSCASAASSSRGARQLGLADDADLTWKLLEDAQRLVELAGTTSEERELRQAKIHLLRGGLQDEVGKRIEAERRMQQEEDHDPGLESLGDAVESYRKAHAVLKNCCASSRAATDLRADVCLKLAAYEGRRKSGATEAQRWFEEAIEDRERLLAEKHGEGEILGVASAIADQMRFLRRQGLSLAGFEARLDRLLKLASDPLVAGDYDPFCWQALALRYKARLVQDGPERTAEQIQAARRWVADAVATLEALKRRPDGGALVGKDLEEALELQRRLEAA